MTRRMFRMTIPCCILLLFHGYSVRAMAQAARTLIAQNGGQAADTTVTRSQLQMTLTVAGGPPPGPMQIGAFSAGGRAFGLREDTEVVRHEPYQAEAVTEFSQTLANGTHISQTITATVARDSDGRTYRSQKLGEDRAFISIYRVPEGPTPSSAANAPPTLTVVFDPVAKEHIDYLSDVKVAHILPVEISSITRGDRHVRVMPGTVGEERGETAPLPPPGGPEAGVTSGGGPGGMAIMAFPPGDGAQGDEQTSALGMRAIHGIATVGTRRTWTIPKGAIGNDRPLITTEETWYSPKLKLVVQSIRDDPRFGQTTFTLTNIRLTEPSSKLFEIPPGYRIERFPLPPAPPGPPVDGGGPG